MNENSKAHLALFIVALIYGANYSIAKIALPEFIEPFGFILCRVAFGLVVFWAISFFQKTEKISIRKEDRWRFLACAFTGVAFNQLMFFKGLSLTSPINASIIMLTTPILVLVLSGFILGEKWSIKGTVGILAGAAGAFLLIGAGESYGAGSRTGDLFILLNSSSYAFYLILVKPLMKKYPPLFIIRWIFTIGIFFIIPFSLQQFNHVEWATFTMPVWASFVFVILFATVFTYGLNIYALKKVSPSVVGFYIYLQPLLASLIAISMGKDELNVLKCIAALLIFIGVYLIQHIRPTATKNAA